jgi:hypothetical protein
MRMFDVRSLMVKLQDFAGPRMELVGRRPRARAHRDLHHRGAEAADLDEDMMITLIKENTGTASWDINPKAAIQINNGVLVVSQTPSVLREIESLLGLLGSIARSRASERLPGPRQPLFYCEFFYLGRGRRLKL